MSETKEEKKEKCFIIMPISDQGNYPMGHFTKVYEQIIKPAVEEAGYETYRVDENTICDSIINKIFSAIQECPMAICDLSNRNPNVLYELGLRQAYDKPVVLIQDDKTQKIFDVSGISTVFYKSTRLYEDVMEARENIKNAILSTKEGKRSTLAKVIKVSTADFSKVEISQDDKTNVMLEGIYSEIRELKSRVGRDSLPANISDPKNSSDLEGPDTIRPIRIFFGCEDFNTIKQFKDKVMDEVVGLITVDYQRTKRNKWAFLFHLRKYMCTVETIKSIYNIATEFNLQFTENYSIV